MAITFFPSEFSQLLAPKKLIDKLASKTLTPNKAAVRMLANVADINTADAQETVLKVLKQYKEKTDVIYDGSDLSRQAAREVATNDNALLTQRVRNLLTFESTQKVKENYLGTRYVWLPSSANEADPLHQLNYGKTFTLGEGDDNGEDPGDRYGCQCGMRILTDDEELDIFE